MATSPLVPGRLPVAIEDHPYQIEPSGFRRQTVQVLRQQADVSSEPGEASLNPQGLWRRSQESWHHGAGQEFLDGKDEKAADPHRFRSSKGVDIWTRGQVSLLHPTIKSWSTTNSNLHLAVALQNINPFYLYVADGNELYHSTMPYGLINSLAGLTGSGWTATNATITPDTDGPFLLSFNLTATAAASVSVTSPTGTSGAPVQAGRQYKAHIHTQYTSGGAPKIPRISVTWYTAAGASISTTAPVVSATADIGGGGAFVSTTITAPATAAFASITGDFTDAWANGEIHWVRSANLTPADAGGLQAASSGWGSAVIHAGEAAQPIQSIVSNGSYVWAALGTSGLHRNTAGNSTSTANVPAAPAGGQIHLVGYANGFLLAAGSTGSTTGKNTLWNVTSPLGAPALSVIKTHDNPSFEWTGVAPGRACVYVFGNSGGNGEVYKVTFDPNTGTLSTAASPATYLPDGETIHALQFYAGGIILGTGKGVRLGQADGAGNIDYGPLVPTDWPVRCLEPQDRYCWFGWTKYDATNSGLGRVDLGYFTDTLTPAWASDLMTDDTTQGDVVSCVTFMPYGYSSDQQSPVRAFTVAGEGVYVEDPYARVAQGTIETGTIRFSTSEPKTARSVDVRHHALPAGGPVTVEMQKDSSGTWTTLGSSSTAGSYGPAAPLDAGSLPAEALELRITLDKPDNVGTDFTQTPEVTRWTAKVLPTPSTIDETFTIPLIMRREVQDSNGANYPVDVDAEVAYLKGLERSRALVTLQLGDESHTVYLLASEFEGQNWGPGRAFMEGILTTQWQSVRG